MSAEFADLYLSFRHYPAGAKRGTRKTSRIRITTVSGVPARM